MQHKIKLLNKEQDWSRLKNYRPNEVVNHNGKQWQNVTGLNSEPSDSSFDWVNIDFNKAGNTDNVLLKPEEDGSLDDFPYVVGINREADTVFLSANSFGKVDTVMGVKPDANKNVDISGIETNWTNANQQWSGLVDKSSDATYDKIMVLDSNGKAGTKNLDYAIPYVGANKAIDLNTQKLLTDGTISTSNGNNVINLVSRAVAGNQSLNSIVFKIKGSVSGKLNGTYSFEIFKYPGISYKFNITSYFHQNNWHIPLVTWTSGNSSGISSVNLLKKSDSEFYIEIIFTSTYSTMAVKVDWLGYNSALNHEFNLYRGSEVDLTTSTISNKITPSQFIRDPYLLDFRNFTNVPDFAQSSDFFAKDEATNWTNKNQQWSGLADKGADATYDKIMVLDNNGKAGTKDAGDLGYIPLSGTKEGKPLEGLFTANDYEIVSNGEANGKPTSLTQSVGDSDYSVVAIQGEDDLVSTFTLSLDEGFIFTHNDNINNKYAYQYLNKDGYKLLAGGIAFETQEGKAKLTDFNTEEPFLATEDDDIVTKAYLNADTLIDILTNATPAQVNQIKTLLDI